MAQAREFDVLVVREMDRLSRRLAKQLIIEEELKRAGVEIEYVLATYEDNPEGNLSKQIKAVVSEYERLKINERMSRGRRVKARSGSIIATSHPPYGYNFLVEGGKTSLEINPKEAEIVKLVYGWCAGGMSLHAIQRELTRLAIPTPSERHPVKTYSRKLRKAGEWGRSTIFNILQNECYTGSWYYGKQSPIAPNSDKMVTNSKDTWIRVGVPAIVTPEQWEATRRVLAKNRERGGGNIKADYLLRGRVFCGDCHARMFGTSNTSKIKTYNYYVCRSPLVGKKLHRKFTFPSKLVDDITWKWVRQLLLDPQAIGEGLAAYKQEQEKSAAPVAEKISMVEKVC